MSVTMVEPRTLYLEADGLGRLELDYAHGYVVTKQDLGHPTVRAVTQDRVGVSGTQDDTAFYGARAVSLEVACFAPDDGAFAGKLSRRDVLARLRAYASPGRRPVLVWREDDGVLRRVVLRGDSAPLAFERAPLGASVKVQLTFTAPSGVLELLTPTTASVSAAATPGTGRGFPVRLPFAFPRTSTFNTTTVENTGTEAAPPRFKLWGPCTGPVLLNLTTGERVSLPGLVLTAQQYVEVDVENATLRLNARPAESLYAYQEWGVSSFGWLAPGRNLLRYSPTTWSLGAHADVEFRERSI